MKRVALVGLFLAGALWWLAARSSSGASKNLTPIAAPMAANQGQTARPGGSPSRLPVVATRRGWATGERLFHGGWGGEPGQFGRRHDPESNPEAPMAIAAGAPGALALVDQANGRVQLFHNGKPSGQIRIGDTIQDLALAPGGATALLDRLHDRNLQLFGADGQPLGTVPIVGRGLDEGGSATGVFADDEGFYVERDHEAVVRVADRAGKPDTARPELPGRPTRDGRAWVSAAIFDRGAGRLMVQAVDRRTGRAAWQREIELSAPILRIVLLDSDRRGRIYVGADVGRESSGPPFVIEDEMVSVVRLESSGDPRGAITLPPLVASDESIRPITVDDDGTLYAMYPSDSGLDVMRFVFP